MGPKGAVRLRTSVTTRRYHANELERRTRCAPWRARPGSCSTISGSTVRGSSGTSSATWPRRRRPIDGCARCTGRLRPGSPVSSGRTRTWCRRIATSWSTVAAVGAGGGTLASTRPSIRTLRKVPRHRAARHRGRRHRGVAVRRARRSRVGGGRVQLILGAGASRLATGARPRAGVRPPPPRPPPGRRSSARGGPACPEVAPAGAVRGAQHGRVRRVPERQDELAVHPVRVAEELRGEVVA